MTPTKEQQAVISAQDKSLKMIAFAGTGKTSTFVGRAHAHTRERGLYLAFNKTVADEAKTKFPAWITPKTTHSLAFANIIGRSGKYTLGRLSMFKVARLFKLDYYLASLVLRTVENFCNSAEFEIGTEHAEPDFIHRYNYDVAPILVDFAKKVWNMVLEASNPDFPMTHSGYLKLYQLSKPTLRYDMIMLDEAQDTNPVTQDIVLRQADHAKIFLAGDPYQQIYAWRGAVDSLSRIEAPSYYLTQSFRFGPQIANVANTLLRTFFGEKRELIGLGQQGEILDKLPAPPYTYLARTNAFLFAHASTLAGRFRIYTPSGKQGGELPLFESVMNVYYLWKGEKDKIRDPELKLYQDYWELHELVEQGQTDAEYIVCCGLVDKFQANIPNLVEQIRKSLVPTPEQAEIILITAHRAKGLEWDNVILCDDFRPLYDDETGQLRPLGENWKREISPGEINLLYVASTRARKCLKPTRDLAVLLNQFGNLPVATPVAASN